MNLEFWRHTLRARIFDLLRRRDAALAEYRAALRAEPRSVRTHHTVAFLLAGAKRYGEAEPHLLEVVRLEPDNARAWFNLGFLYDQQHNAKKAVDAFGNAVRLDPANDRAWYGLGLSLATLGDHVPAAAALARAAELQPMNGIAWYHLGMAYHALDRRQKVTEVANHLNRFERKLARQLIQDTGRDDLRHLIADMVG